MPSSGSSSAISITTPAPPAPSTGSVFRGFMPSAPYGDVGSSNLFVPLPAGSVVSRSHPDYQFVYLADSLFYVSDNPPLKWRITRTDGATPSRPTSAVVTVRDSLGALVASLTPESAPSPAPGSVELAALWPIVATGTYIVQIRLTMPTDGQIRSSRFIVLVR